LPALEPPSARRRGRPAPPVFSGPPLEDSRRDSGKWRVRAAAGGWRALAAPHRALRVLRPPPSPGHQTALATRPSGRWMRLLSSWDTPGRPASERRKRRCAATAAWVQPKGGQRPACSRRASPIRRGVDHAIATDEAGSACQALARVGDRPEGLRAAIPGSQSASRWTACMVFCRGSSRRTEVAVSRLHRPRATSAGRHGVGRPRQPPSPDGLTGTRHF